MKGKVAVAALLVALVAGAAEAKKPGSGSGGVSTNYGCATLIAGSTVYNSTTTKKLLVSTYACYLCNMTTRVCAIQSPSTLVGWYFNLP
jgi:hypothetical protein